ncbi:hypothetical protein AVEN_250286-1 [Araneus ventricosus]|uniref:Uncharacterized protein n=1 Tax=Araneus ventricosus TaxID=182803 RepID=A0A4Y2N2U1_ARAVE|nr:hypothetical protein AVEN_145564-1 [Araneus ventricosus]GBN59654.1 hypothetical protein AVEN_250286-1 [Araneus ventricosus]
MPDFFHANDVLSWTFRRRLSYTICPKTGSFHLLVEIFGKAFTDVPKVCPETRFKVAEFYLPPPLHPHGRFRISFLVSTRAPNVGRSFDLPLPSHRGLKLESAD